MSTQTVLGIVRHQAIGHYRFAIICKEFLSYPADKVVVRGIEGVDPNGSHNEVALYKNGSIYSKQISDWIVKQHLDHEARGNYALLKFEFDYDKKSKIATFTYKGISPDSKVSKRYAIISDPSDLINLGKQDFSRKVIAAVWRNILPK